jgi:hypothetical protein
MPVPESDNRVAQYNLSQHLGIAECSAIQSSVWATFEPFLPQTSRE